jgi:hypothetical protein
LEVIDEFINQGFEKDTDLSSLKKSYNIHKSSDGNWYKSTKLDRHSPPDLTPLDLSSMASLLRLITLIESVDRDFKKDGGRIFITENQVFKRIRGSEHTILNSALSTDPDVTHGQNKLMPNTKICDEINSLGINYDRHRAEATFLLVRSKSGSWSISSSHENLSKTSTNLILDKMPLLQSVLKKIVNQDSKLKINGGRIFITEKRIYRINNKCEIDYIL